MRGGKDNGQFLLLSLESDPRELGRGCIGVSRNLCEAITGFLADPLVEALRCRPDPLRTDVLCWIGG